MFDASLSPNALSFRNSDAKKMIRSHKIKYNDSIGVTSQIIWEVIGVLCPREIVLHGMIPCTSVITRRFSLVIKLLLPSQTKFIASKRICESERVKSVTIPASITFSVEG
jgi:hypothetical protein